MVETVEAMCDLDAIAATPGVDVVLVGPVDLGLALGLGLDVSGSHPTLVAAMREIVAACAEHGKVAGGVAMNPPNAELLLELGMRFLTIGSDAGYLVRRHRRRRQAGQGPGHPGLTGLQEGITGQVRPGRGQLALRSSGAIGEPGEAAGLAAQHGAPQLVGLVGEEVGRLGVEHEPGAGLDLALELAGSPAGVAAEHAQRADRRDDVVGVGGEVGGREVAAQRGEVLRVDLVRCGSRMRAIAINASGSTGPPTKTVDGSGLDLRPRAERIAELLRARPVEHEPERTLVVVLEHVDHRPVEVRVLERGRGEQQPSLGRRARRSSLPFCHWSTGSARHILLHEHAALRMIMRWHRSARHHRCVRVHRRRAAPPAGRPSRRSTSWSRPPTPRRARRPATLYPSLAAAYPDLELVATDDAAIAAVDGLDVVFMGLPHEASMALAPQLVGKVGCVVDLSAAYRLKDASLYPQWYGFEHDQPELLAEAVYGLPERHRKELVGARLVATPGCYVTAATLALAPLLDAGLVERTGLIVDAASGVTGAGRAAKPDTTFCAVDENFNAYGLLDHRHTPEIEQNLAAAQPGPVHAAPRADEPGHPGDVLRPPGRRRRAVDGHRARRAARRLRRRAVRRRRSTGRRARSRRSGSNTAHVTARYDERTGTVLAIAALDNLTKGASGGALQAANVALGLDETLGLPLVGVAP